MSIQGEFWLATTSLSDLYRAYIDCLNQRDWAEFGRYVDDDVEHNGQPLKLSGYRDMLMKDSPTSTSTFSCWPALPRSSRRAWPSHAPQRGGSSG